jgi:hypothetical protein
MFRPYLAIFRQVFAFGTRDKCPTSGNIHKKGAQIWKPRKENSAERRESFVLKQTYLSVNNDMQYHLNILICDLVQCDGFRKWTIAWKVAK